MFLHYFLRSEYFELYVPNTYTLHSQLTCQKIFFRIIASLDCTNTLLFLSLTLRAVVSLPALQTDAVALLITGVVAQRVVSWSAVVRASVPKVKLVTEDVIGVTQLALLAKVHILGPVLTDGESPLGRQTTHKVVLVV